MYVWYRVGMKGMGVVKWIGNLATYWISETSKKKINRMELAQ